MYLNFYIVFQITAQHTVGLFVFFTIALFIVGLLLPYVEPPVVTTSTNPDDMPASPVKSNSIIDVDTWHYLVSLCFSMPSLFAERSYSIPVGKSSPPLHYYIISYRCDRYQC